MKLLLTTLNAKYIHQNLAIRLLYSLHKHRIGISWKEFTIKEDRHEIAQQCAMVDIVAFSCYIWNIKQTLQVAQIIKQINPSSKILLGGPEVSYEYEDIIKLPFVDYIIVGEGEIPFAQFLENYPDVDSVANLLYKQNDTICFKPQQVQFDLQNYAGINPYQYDSVGELYNKICYIETSRGCPYKCEFCLASLDNKVRYLPMEDIKRNLLYVMQEGRVIKFLDRTFNVKKDFTIEIFRFILKHRKPGQVFQFEITADIVHPDIVSFINEEVPEGVFRFEIGIQTVNQQANLQVSRKQNFEKTSSVIKKLNHKIEMHLDLIVGLPLDEWSDIKYSVQEVFALHPPELQLGFLKFLKGTPLRHKYAEHDYVFDAEAPYEIIKSKYLSSDQLADLRLLEEALEIYWNKKRAIHSLIYAEQTIGIFDFLLGLGKLFFERSHFHKHTLFDVYDVLMEYADTVLEKAPLLKEMVMLDYYLQTAIKPQVRYGTELNDIEKRQVKELLGLKVHQYRYLFFGFNFDAAFYITNRIIKIEDCIVVFAYNGKSKPNIICEAAYKKGHLLV
jgi:anaerobic magnesium-protoporphyrin IX monomethyl ester cyclase